MKNRLINKKLRSLASRCLTSDDTLSDARDLLTFYDADFKGFFHRFSIDCLGFPEDVPIASKRPPQRKPGERPEKNPRNRKQELQKSEDEDEDDQDIPMESAQERPSWEKKLYRQIMMQVHPDRLDTVSRNSKDKLMRMGFAEKMTHAPKSEIILSIGIQLNLETELELLQQRKLLAVYLQTSDKNLNEVKSYAAWVWGESVDNDAARLKIVKQILWANSISPPEDAAILDALEDHK